VNLLLVQDHLQAGGAARAASRWAQLLRGAGHTVTQAAGDVDVSGAIQLSGKPPRGIGRLVELIAGKQGFRARRLARQFDQLLASEPWDAVWFHNLAGGQKWGWSDKMIGMARAHAPVLWTLHDMWALGSGEGSYWAVEETALGSGKGQGASGGKREGKKGKKSRAEEVCRAGGKFPVTLTAPSKWLADLAHKITCFECVHLPNPIDLDTFSPGDQAEARRELGLPEKGALVLAGADSLQDTRKGFDLLREAWGKIRPGTASMALFGRHGQVKPGLIYLGNLESDGRMAAAYRAANLYVHPARQENAPCTIQESMACGTPVLAFSVGGIPEMIAPDQNGFLVESVGGLALADGLEKALSNPSRLAAMGRGCRGSVERDYGPGVLLEKFHRLGPGFSRS